MYIRVYIYIYIYICITAIGLTPGGSAHLHTNSTQNTENGRHATIKRKIIGKSGPSRNELTGEWRKLHDEELNNLHPSPTIVQVIQSRRMRWAGHVARWGRRETCTGVWWGNQRERDNWGDPSVDGWLILGWMFRMWNVGYGLDWSGSGSRQVAGTCECVNEPSGSIKCVEFLD
jgi:hypothetical protein